MLLKVCKIDPLEVVEKAIVPTQASKSGSSAVFKNDILGGLLGAVLCGSELLFLSLLLHRTT